jgi:uncharacterized membrane protein
MPKSTLAGHPLHPQLIAAPMGLLPFSCVMDLMYLATGDEEYADAAYYTLVGGLVGGVAAGAAGAVDYLAIGNHQPAKKAANLHAILNIAALSLWGVNLSLRRRRQRSGRLVASLSVIGTLALLVSQWFGGYLVYNKGLRVKNIDPLEAEPDLALPGDKALHDALHGLEHSIAPEQGVVYR